MTAFSSSVSRHADDENRRETLSRLATIAAAVCRTERAVAVFKGANGEQIRVQTGMPGVPDPEIASFIAELWRENDRIRTHNVAQSERWRSVPLVRRGGAFAAFAAVPIINPDNEERVGWVAALAPLPHQWTNTELDALSAAADFAVAGLSRRRSQGDVGMLTQFVTDANYPIAMFDTNMRYIAHSDAWLHDFGSGGSGVTLVGRSYYDVFPNTPERWRAIHRDCLAGATRRADRDSMHAADGSLRYLRWTMRPWLQSDGEIGGIVMVAMDTTAHWAAYARVDDYRKRLDTALTVGSSAAIELNVNTGDLYATRHLAAMLGRMLTAKERSGRIYTLIHPADRKNFWRAWRAHRRSGDPMLVEVRLANRAKKDLWVSIRARIVRTEAGKAERIIAFVRDIDEIIEARRAQDASRRAAEQSDRAKSQFIATISHEMRTPLNGVLGMSRALAINPRVEKDERLKPQIDLMVEAGEELERLVIQVLELSAIDLGAASSQPQPAPFDMLGVIRAVCAGHRAQADSKNLTLDVDVGGGVGRRLGDAALIKRALDHVIDNAVKFTESGGVVVTATGDADHSQIAVRDTGPGLPPHAGDHIFERFTKGRAGDVEGNRGVGLGLALARETMRMLGGDVTGRTHPDGGAEFVLTAPVPRHVDTPTPEDAPAPLEETDEDTDTPLRILCAEDNARSRAVLRALLSSLEAEPIMAENGLEAVRLWRETPVDAIFMDVQMPEMDGISATQEIRRLETTSGRARTPIIAVTANALPEHRTACLEAGMDAHIAKPIDPAALFAALELLLDDESADEMSSA